MPSNFRRINEPMFEPMLLAAFEKVVIDGLARWTLKESLYDVYRDFGNLLAARGEAAARQSLFG